MANPFPTNRTRSHRFAMCPPELFDVNYRINPWMDPNGWHLDAQRNRALAARQWNALREVLARVGAAVELVRPVPGLPDMVFTANAGVALDGVVIVSRFRHPERRPESAHFAAFFADLSAAGAIARVIETPAELAFEGAGDCLWDAARQQFWFGWGQRSSPDAARLVETTFGAPVVALELVDPRFYHLDTCLRPLPGGELLLYPPAFSAESRRAIQEVCNDPARLIPVDYADAANFAVNAVSVGEHVILSSAGDALVRTLNAAGYTVHQTPLTAFHRSGGSALCLTLSLTDRRLRASDKAAA
jgi:N-dimethylarginine dimethylaminohydrolase